MLQSEKSLLSNTVKIVSGHEFRTPMNGIFGFAQLLYNGGSAISHQEQKEFSLGILESAKRLMSLSERIGTWFFLSQNKNAIDQSYSFTSADIINLVKTEAEKFSVEGDMFHFSHTVEKFSVKGRKDIIHSALAELFNNAFKFSSKNKMVSVRVFQRDNSLVISIQNYSDVSTVDELKSYTAFTQFNRPKFEQQGLGLGIEIAKLGLAESGGNIQIVDPGGDSSSNLITIEAVLPLSNIVMD